MKAFKTDKTYKRRIRFEKIEKLTLEKNSQVSISFLECLILSCSHSTLDVVLKRERKYKIQFKSISNRSIFILN